MLLANLFRPLARPLPLDFGEPTELIDILLANLFKPRARPLPLDFVDATEFRDTVLLYLLNPPLPLPRPRDCLFNDMFDT